MEILHTLFYFIVTIGILVFVHELGHFLAAKLTGMRVERFSIGFPPRAFGKKVGDTDYCISWIPVGGYVKISGMIDESFDTDFVNRPPEPYEFRAKPLWARVLVITAGVMMNVLLAIVIFWGINYAQGKLLRDTTEIGYVAQDSPAHRIGLMAGDKVVAINQKVVTHWDEIPGLVYLENAGGEVAIDVDRGAARTRLILPARSVSDLSAGSLGILPAHTVPVVGNVETGKPAEALGLKPRDIIVSLDGTPVFNEHHVIAIIKGNIGREIRVVWKRGDQVFEGVTMPTDEGRIGVSLGSMYVGPTRHARYTILGAFPEGLKDIVRAGGMFYGAIVQLVKGTVSFSQSFGGPIKIAQIATQSAEGGVANYLAFMALLSMSLAILNIVPFPALDGGHLMVMLIEAAFRREIPHRAKLVIQQAGFFILLAFMAFVIYNDIRNF
jgi:regulator of sigma E protease